MHVFIKRLTGLASTWPPKVIIFQESVQVEKLKFIKQQYIKLYANNAGYI